MFHEQTNKITVKQYILLDVSQTLSKVWHEGLLYKLKKNISEVKLYISESYFRYIPYATEIT